MTDRFTDPLEDFVNEALFIAHNRNQSINSQRIDFERLVAAVYEYSRQKVHEQIKEQRRKDFEEELRKPPYM